MSRKHGELSSVFPHSQAFPSGMTNMVRPNFGIATLNSLPNGSPTHKVIPNFRDAAAAALGERWASTPPGWFEPGGEKPSFLNDGDSSSSTDGGENDDRSFVSPKNGAHSRTPGTPPVVLGRREIAATGEGSRGNAVGVAPPLPTTPPPAAVRGVITPLAPGRALETDSNADGANSIRRGEEPVAPCFEPSIRNGGGGGGGGGCGRGSDAGVARADGTGKKRPYTSERNNAKDLAQYLGVPGPDNDNGSSGTGGGGRAVTGGEKRGVGGLTLATMDEKNERHGEGSESQVRGTLQD